MGKRIIHAGNLNVGRAYSWDTLYALADEWNIDAKKGGTLRGGSYEATVKKGKKGYVIKKLKKVM
jgi:hypothetical protein